MLTLYTAAGQPKTTFEPDDSGRQNTEVQGEDTLTLSFKLYRYMEIGINDYVEFLGSKYIALERYLPRQESTVEWKYDITLYGPVSLIKRYLVLNNDGSPVFSLTATPAEHLQLIVDSINAAQPSGLQQYSIGEIEGDTDQEITIDYNATYCNEALQQLAEKLDTEFWMKDGYVNLSKCIHGEEIALRYGQELTNLEREINSNQKYFTRLFPIGSTKNIEESEYGYDRLQLPEIDGIRLAYIQQDAETYGIIDHAEEEAFKDIYPVYVGEVHDVWRGPHPNYYYQIRDRYFPFNPADCLIDGQPAHIKFLSGKLLGLGDEDASFEVTYDQTNNYLEIHPVQQEDSSWVPGNQLIPEVGDIYVITNIKTPDVLIKYAEQEFLKRARWLMEQSRRDISKYKAQTNYLQLGRNDIDLSIGQRVKLYSSQYFPTTGYSSSRITRISRHVNIPLMADIEIAETLTTSTFQSLTRKVELTYAALLASKEKEYDVTPSRPALEWNAGMGEIPVYAIYVKLTANEEDEYNYLPAEPELRRYTVENISDHKINLVGNNRHYIKPSNSVNTQPAIFLQPHTIKTFLFSTDNIWYEMSI